MSVLDFFPHKTFRPYQKETILDIQQSLDSDEIENVVLESPTGSGKSAIAISLGLYYKSAFLLTSQKILQDQYVKDYSSGRVCVLKGRNNYPCKLYANFTCEDSYCSTKQCPIKPECYYEIAKQQAVESYVALMNYKYFLCITNYTGTFSLRKLLICDEAHSLDDECMSFVEFSFSSLYLSKLGVTSKIPIYEKLDEYIEWLRMLVPIIKERKKEVTEKLKNKFLDIEIISDLQKELEGLASQEERVKVFLESYTKVEWIFDITTNEKLRSKTIIFKPLTVGFFAQRLLFKNAEKKLFMSATILDKESFCRNLDLEVSKTKFIQVPSTFSPDIRPIILTRSGNLGKNNIEESLPKVVQDIEKILDFHDTEKGLLHCHTYRIANYIKENIGLKFRERIILHDSSTRTAALNNFMLSDEPKVLVTPSMTEGIDLKDDLARFVVIVKLPFMFLGDKQIKQRMEIDPEWYNWKTALTLVQAAGRGVRHDKDFCTIYIMDSQFKFFLKQNSKFFPKYFVDAIKN
ncbi:MAG: ATP-dependent DNA helicase [Candidatus Nanoarchaeia archaeon]|jgi:Rad3-related DNA helicase|nr:ATP-dependent DNA helicase [Candidatus Nanoarchaeia archaeon]